MQTDDHRSCIPRLRPASRESRVPTCPPVLRLTDPDYQIGVTGLTGKGWGKASLRTPLAAGDGFKPGPEGLR